MAIIWIIVVGIAWAFFSEIVIIMVEQFGRVYVVSDKKLSKTLYRWTLFALGELHLALFIALVRWLHL